MLNVEVFKFLNFNC